MAMTWRTTRSGLFGLILALLSAVPAASAAGDAGQTGSATGTQTQAPPATARPDPQVKPPGDPAEDQALDRIRKGLEKPPSRLLQDERLRFYALVIAKEPTIEQIIGSYDLKYGPTRGGNPMSHQEFLNMVTPREMYGSAGVRPAELLQFALVNWAGQAIIKRGIEALHKAKSERELQEIRDRIDKELEALRRRGGG